MKTKEDIDWNLQAKEFLQLHGWHNEPESPFGIDTLFHPCYPLGEDCSEGYEELAEWYGEAWKTYKEIIKTYKPIFRKRRGHKR